MSKVLYNDELRPVVGYEDKYLVSRFGLVYSIPRLYHSSNKVQIPGGLLKRSVNHSGYYTVTLSRSGNKVLVHRIVAMAFLPNPGNKPYVNHKDGNRLNPHVDNLEWCTAKENYHHAVRTGLYKFRPKKLTCEQVDEIKNFYTAGLYSQRDLANRYGCSQRLVFNILKGEGAYA